MIGASLGPYRILDKLGEGGMGEVYRARDTKLDRDVALKMLPASFADDPERLARFEREAKTLASLNHPHIAHIHGFEDTAGVRALVMELVEGPTLAERIAQGPLALDEALPIARQIAEALEAAHELGIIHRDLKPANVKVRPDGTVKVLDFGLAKLNSTGATSASGTEQLLNSPTRLGQGYGGQATEPGMILGTAAYMSPEQAKGRPVDKRADIWAFGVVLYEMLSGRALFTGESATDVLGAVLRQAVDLATLPSGTPQAIRRLLQRCLERDPKHRLHDIADARIEIVDQLDSPEQNDTASALAATRTHRAALAGLAIAVLALASVSFWAGRGRGLAPSARPAYRFTIPQPAGGDVPAISPDGRHLVYVGRGQLLLRALDEAEPRALEGTDGAREPFWSPDSSSIGFFAAGALKRISIAGGPAEALSAVPSGWPVGSWSSNGTILVEVTENSENEGWYVLSPGSPLRKLRAFAADRPINPDKAFPSFLPDGEHFLFTHPMGDVATLQVGSIRSDESHSLVPADSRAFFVESGFVLYVRSGTLFAQPFNPERLAMTGEPVAVVDKVDYFAPTGEAQFSVSQEGTLVFRPREGRSQLRWFHRDGRQAGGLLGLDYYADHEISRDGQRVVAAITDPRRSTTDLWVVDIERNVSTRLTSSPRSEMSPRWSPDGSRLVFSTDWQGPPNLYVADAGGGEPRVLVPFDRTQQYAGGWTPDGSEIVYAKRADTFLRDIWGVKPATGERRSILATEFNEFAPTVSPSGQWLAYVSDASGRSEVYLRAFAEGTWQTRLSTDGGSNPVWRNDGRELFYYQPDGSIMAVQIASSTASAPRASLPARLFQIDVSSYRSFDVAPDGQRFLINQADPGGLSPPDEVVVDWLRLLKK
jgi:hypothetical protein